MQEPKSQNLRVTAEDYALFKDLQAKLESELAYGAKLTVSQVFAICVNSTAAVHARGDLKQMLTAKRER